MSATIIPFNNKEHGEKVASWGEKYKFPFPGEEFLPDIGLVVNDTAAGFLYTTNSKLGWIEWVFSNPEKTVEERTEALDTLMNSLEKAARSRGIKAIFSASATDAYRKVLVRNGYKDTDDSVTHFIKTEV